MLLLCHFPFVNLLSSRSFSPFAVASISHTSLFFPFCPSTCFHHICLPHPYLSHFPSPCPSLPLSASLSITSIHFSSLVLTRPSICSSPFIHLTLCHFVLPVWPRRSHQVAVRPPVHRTHQNRPDAGLQRRLHARGRSCSHVEPHSGGWLFTLHPFQPILFKSQSF